MRGFPAFDVIDQIGGGLWVLLEIGESLGEKWFEVIYFCSPSFTG